MSVNVDRTNTDMFYRYKMPKIVSKVEGSGNGIKTVIPNIVEVSLALARPARYTLKFFGYELGAQTSIDTKNDRFIVNGSHDSNKLQEMLDGFISKFILCQNCRNPETVLDVNSKKGTIKERCAACGYVGAVDLTHRLSSYILRNPPDNGKKKGKKDKTASGAKEKSGTASPNGQANNEHADGDTNDTPDDEVIPSEEFRGRLEESGFDSDDWSKEAPSNEITELTAAARKLALDEDTEKSEKERLDIFYDFVINAKKSDAAFNAKTIFNEAERLEVTAKAPLILARSLFDENVVKEISAHRKLLLRFVHNNKKAQRHFLGGIEQLVGEGKFRNVLLTKTASILNALYDNDIVSEEVFFSWFEKPSKKYVSMEVARDVREKAKKFIVWLREAEEEEDDEEDDDEEEEEEDEDELDDDSDVSSDASKNAKKDDDGVEDVDIDAI